MRKIPENVKKKALAMWFEGYSYREISRKLGVSTGEMSNIAAEERERTPDLDQLRRINVMVMKEGGSVSDAVRGVKLLDVLNERGVGLDTLHSYIELSNRISSDKGVEAERFVDSSMKLMSLESKTGKSYWEVLKDFEERIKQIEGLDAKAKSVQDEIQKLMEARAQLEGEIREVKERRSASLQELNQAISTRERLRKIGLEKVSQLAPFIEDFELLKFDVNVVKRLAEWRKSLTAMGIDPDGLERFVKEKGPLEAQISKMRSELKDVERKIEATRNEHRRLFEETTSLQAEVLKLSRLGKVVKLRKIIIACRVCGRQGIFVKLRTASEYRGMMRSGAALQYRCFNCGQWVAYTPWDILIEVGLMVA